MWCSGVGTQAGQTDSRTFPATEYYQAFGVDGVTVTRRCKTFGDNYYLYKASSYHDNDKEDRRWTYGCRSTAPGSYLIGACVLYRLLFIIFFIIFVFFFFFFFISSRILCTPLFYTMHARFALPRARSLAILYIHSCLVHHIPPGNLID